MRAWLTGQDTHRTPHNVLTSENLADVTSLQSTELHEQQGYIMYTNNTTTFTCVSDQVVHYGALKARLLAPRVRSVSQHLAVAAWQALVQTSPCKQVAETLIYIRQALDTAHVMLQHLAAAWQALLLTSPCKQVPEDLNH